MQLGILRFILKRLTDVTVIILIAGPTHIKQRRLLPMKGFKNVLKLFRDMSQLFGCTAVQNSSMHHPYDRTLSLIQIILSGFLDRKHTSGSVPACFIPAGGISTFTVEIN